MLYYVCQTLQRKRHSLLGATNKTCCIGDPGVYGRSGSPSQESARVLTRKEVAQWQESVRVLNDGEVYRQHHPSVAVKHKIECHEKYCHFNSKSFTVIVISSLTVACSINTSSIYFLNESGSSTHFRTGPQRLCLFEFRTHWQAAPLASAGLSPCAVASIR